MRLISFSVTNYRSITMAHKLPINSSTILIGQNNEGKSNILNALTTAMGIIRFYGTSNIARAIPRNRVRNLYDWERDFPVQLQGKKTTHNSTFRLEFELTVDDIYEFKTEIKSNLNGTLPIEISIGEDLLPAFKVLKKGPGGTTLSKKSSKIAYFIGKKIDYIYIPAVRTAKAAVSVVEQMLEDELATLEEDERLIKALNDVAELQKPILEKISQRISEPLKQFLPQIRNIEVKISEEARYRALRRSCEIIIDDGIPTSIERKGDGVKSLAAISLLRGEKLKGRASILALEEPESHLHPSAIHRLKEVIDELSKEHQVVITTHCPLFVDRVNIGTNILISKNTAKTAKKISEIRDILGVKASDNLVHAKLVLIVEGDDDKKSLTDLFNFHSVPLKNAIKTGLFIIDTLNGASNLSYKASMYHATVCMTHAYLDNDDAGRKAIQKAEDDGLLKVRDYHLVICNGMQDAEFEDCLNFELYKDAIQLEYGVNLDTASFRNNKKWSNRMRETFLSQAKGWSDSMESKVKYTVADCISRNPELALNEHKRSSFDALMVCLEEKVSK
jgi:AAA15 family ATPase/GTPase